MTDTAGAPPPASEILARVREIKEGEPSITEYSSIMRAYATVQNVRWLCDQVERDQARIAELEADDNPDWDATESAHPAWWRGHDHTTAIFCREVTEILDGKEPTGVSREPWETLRQRLWTQRGQVEHAQAELARLETENERLLNDWARNLARDLVVLGEAEDGKVAASFAASAAARIHELEAETHDLARDIVRFIATPSPQHSDVAYEFAQRAYEATGGVTPELQHAYDAYLDNERRREAPPSPQQAPSPESNEPQHDYATRMLAEIDALTGAMPFGKTNWETRRRIALTAITEAEQAARAEAFAECAAWLEAKAPKLSGPDYGMAEESVRRALRELHSRYLNDAAALRALAAKPPQPQKPED